ncbi:DUF6461 domain-containing protein [Rhodococcus sp. DK17]|uniref:DUF6461 domain-containing protein n=1 Tax=Rhodococcus sp. DK17 TaxID=186196 RepID=UPI003FD124B5
MGTAPESRVALVRESGGIELTRLRAAAASTNTSRGVFALVERITGVRIAPVLLDDGSFTVAGIRLPGLNVPAHSVPPAIEPLRTRSRYG